METQIPSDMKELFTKTLIKDRQIAIYGEITNELATQVGAAITLLNAENKTEEILAHINSAGGKIVAGLDIYDIIRYSQAPVRGIVFQISHSSAAIILQACKKRQAYKYSEIMIHNIRSNDVDIDEFDPELREKSEKFRLKHANRTKNQEAVLEILSKRTGLSHTDIITLCREEKRFTAEEALKYGFIDEIL